MKTILKRALCGITAFVVAAGAMSYFPADTFPGIARGVTAYAENETNETWRITITADNLADISGDGSEGSPYEITTAEELLAVMEARRTIYAILNDDIVINKDLLKRIDKESGEPSDTSDSIVCWPPIPDGWCINLDGKNHTISGLYINESGKAGLYASLGVGSFKNLTITDSFVKGGDNVGVLIGDSSYSTDSLSADNVKIENTIVRGNNCVGGLFGSLETTTDKTKYARYVVYPSKTGYHNHGSADQIDCDDCRGVAWDPYYYVPKNYADTSQYEITNYHELLGLAKLVNEKNETITASLMNDIVFNENLLDASGNVQVADPIKWTPIGNTPIGTERFYFNGIFNGNGHTISGLYVDGGDYAGLFGKAQGAPRIKGVGIVDSYFKGAKYVGGIAGAYIDVNGIEFDCMAGCFTYNVKLEGTESTTKIGQFIGDISGKGNAKLNSNYCLAEKEEPLPGINCSTMTAEDFESGKVAYLMNKYFTDKGNGDVWGQVVANNENVPVDLFPTAYKIIDNGGSNKVINCAGQYHNHLGSATCPICQTVNPQEPAKDNGVYQIGTPSELLWLADRVNGGSGNQDAVLTNDIDMTGVKWTPIGTKDKAFEWGEFDGQGHFITNLTVSDTSLEYTGLFGYVTDHATIKNLGVFGEFSGGEYVGGIAGYSENSEITNCFFIGTVSGTNTNGIANEDIIGDTVKNCYFQSDSTDINARTEKQFKSGEVAELLNMLPNGGTQEVWGQTIGADAYPCALTSDNRVIRDYTNLGWHNHTNGTTEDNCPNCVKTPKQENGVYQISTIQELYWFSAYVNNTDSSIKAELANNITVNEDISAQKRIIWTPIGTETKPFTGTFDGKGHIISGLVKENSTEPVGLFGVIGSGAEVSNVGVVNCIFSSTADAGGIAGINEGTITDSYIYNISPGNGALIAASGTGKTDNCFVLNNTDKSAEIAYKLNRSSQTWGCKIGDDKLPTAINEENRVYFGKTYHNHVKNTLYCDDCCDFILTKPT